MRGREGEWFKSSKSVKSRRGGFAVRSIHFTHNNAERRAATVDNEFLEKASRKKKEKIQRKEGEWAIEA